MENKLVPQGEIGKSNNLQHEITFDTVDFAKIAFERASKRLLNPILWHKLAGTASAEFEVTDSQGALQKKAVDTGDYIKIKILGPGSNIGDGYDWIRVEKIENITPINDDDEYCGLKLRASSPPFNNETAHFFKETATSSFIIQRKTKTVTASYHGRNEVPNTSTGNTIDNMRNLMVAAGASAGLSELQWIALLKGFLKDENEE